MCGNNFPSKYLERRRSEMTEKLFLPLGNSANPLPLALLSCSPSVFPLPVFFSWHSCEISLSPSLLGFRDLSFSSWADTVCEVEKGYALAYTHTSFFGPPGTVFLGPTIHGTCWHRSLEKRGGPLSCITPPNTVAGGLLMLDGGGRASEELWRGETASPSPLNLSRRGRRESARGRTERNKKKRKAEQIRKRSEYYFSKDEGGYLWQQRRRKWQRSWKIGGGKETEGREGAGLQRGRGVNFFSLRLPLSSPFFFVSPLFRKQLQAGGSSSSSSSFPGVIRLRERKDERENGF